jgi:flavodoxin
MNSLVIYYSRYGNTKAVAEAIAGQLASCGPVHLSEAGCITPADFDHIDLVVMGVPTYRMKLPEEVRPILEGLPKRTLKGKAVAAFDTSYQMSAFLARFTAAHRLIQKLRRLGGRQIIQPETFNIARTHAGPLLDGEIDRSKEWADQIIALSSRV